MRFSFTSGDDLPHPKKVWKCFTRAVRSRIDCLAIPKMSINNKNCVINIQHCCHCCCSCHHHARKFSTCHDLNQCYSVRPSKTVNKRQCFRGEKPDGGKNYKIAHEEKSSFGEALMGDEDGENGNLEDSPSERHAIDVRAQEFIESFYDRLKLERQKSVEEYFDMLTRSA